MFHSTTFFINRKIKPFFIIATLAFTLTSCGAALIWQVFYSKADIVIAGQSIKDNAGNLYVSGFTATNDGAPDAATKQGLLLKYDSDGKLLWEKSYPNLKVIDSVIEHSANTLIIGTHCCQFSPKENFYNNTNDYFVISKQDGSIIRPLLDTNDAAKIAWVEVSGDLTHIRHTIADDESKQFLSTLNIDGKIIQQAPLTDPTIALKASKNRIYRLSAQKNGGSFVSYSDFRLEAYDKNLKRLWSKPTKEIHQFNNKAYCNEVYSELIIDPSNNLILTCNAPHTFIAKLTSEGSVVFNAEYSQLFEDKAFSTEKNIYHYSYPGTITSFTENGNLLLAVPTTYIYQGDFITFQARSSSLKSDLLLLNIDGESGQLIWNNSVQANLLARKDGLIADHYTPLALSLTDNAVRLTIKGLRGRYNQKQANDNKPFCGIYGAEASADLLPQNACELKETLASYAKDFYFDLTTGKRSNGTRYNIGYANDAFIEKNAITIVGDNSAYGAKSISDLLPLGFYAFSEFAPLPSTSKIQIEKHRLKTTQR